MGFAYAAADVISWRDVDFRHGAVRVTAKPHWGFHPKNWEEREVPVPQRLIKLLQAFPPEKATPDDPVFPSPSGRPGGGMLEKLKIVSQRGKLNCGHCVTAHKLKDGETKTNRCSSGAYSSTWFLHKFRHTYATRHLQDGIDIRTLQQSMGHRDIASTMVYLKGVRNRDIQARLNKGSLAAFAHRPGTPQPADIRDAERSENHLMKTQRPAESVFSHLPAIFGPLPPF
jgi:integrase/recombinase XerD